MNHEAFLQRAIDLAVESVKDGTGGPFGCVIVKDGKIIAEGKTMSQQAMIRQRMPK